MANYQEGVCWKDAARNYICLQTALRSKHMLWNKLPSEMKCIQKDQNCLQSVMWILRNAWAMTDMRSGKWEVFARYCLLGWNGRMADGSLRINMACGIIWFYALSFYLLLTSVLGSEIKCGVWLGNNFFLTRPTAEVTSMKGTLRKPQPRKRSGSWCDISNCSLHPHLQFFWQMSAKPARLFQGTNRGSNQPPLSPCQNQQLNVSDTHLLRLQPPMTLSEQKWEKSCRISVGENAPSTLWWLSSRCWSTECPPDVFLNLWYIYGFLGSYQQNITRKP